MRHSPARAAAVPAAGLLLLAAAAAFGAATNEVPGRILYLPLDTVQNGAFLDVVTSNALGRVTNARTATAKLGAGCEFASKDSYVTVPNRDALNPKRLTVSLWFKHGKDAWVTRTLLEKGVERGYALSIVTGGKESGRRGRLRASVGGKECLSDAPVTDSLWHHAAAVFDGKTLTLYLDGTRQKQTVEVPGGLAPTTHDLTLGMNRSAPSAQEKGHAFDGLIDEVMLFDRALDEQQLKRVLAAARPKFTKREVERRLKELKELLDRGLILQDFYDRKAAECEVVE